MQQKRRRIWIDRFQTLLALRIGFYCVVLQGAVWTIAVIDGRLSNSVEDGAVGAGPNIYFGVAILSALLLTATVVYDAIKFAHKFVGPLYRFRKTVQAIIAGGEVDLVRLRDGDYLLDMRDDLNAMLQVLEMRGAITMKQPGKQAEEAATA